MYVNGQMAISKTLRLERAVFEVRTTSRGGEAKNEWINWCREVSRDVIEMVGRNGQRELQRMLPVEVRRGKKHFDRSRSWLIVNMKRYHRKFSAQITSRWWFKSC
jgi:hypothetical protein